MVIKDRKKFIRALILITGMIIFMNFLIPYISLSHQQVSYKTISVISGDTLWTIAREEQNNNEYYQRKDIRDIIYDIKRVNNLTSADLKINQSLEIPTY